jgi:prolyl-tRNA editing enzyme YbaK/EbsC (Cys-tRNA(Pro) deacylase)
MNSDSGPESTVIASLAQLGVEYELIKIDPEYADTAALCEQYGYPLENSANAIVIASKRGPKQYSACLALATTRVDVNKTVRNLMGVKRVSCASAEDMAALTGMRAGGVTPFALPADILLYVDSRVMDLEWIIVGSGGRNSKLKVSPDALRKLSNFQLIEGLASEFTP